MYKKKKMIIIIMCIMILLMTVGYAAFSTGLKINGTANIGSSWNVYFESITTKSIAGGVTNKENPKVENLTATMNIDFTAPGDKIVYEVVLKNGGTLDAVVNSIIAEKGGTPQIDCTVTGIKKGDKILKGQSKKITITLEFNSEAEVMPSLKEGFIKVELECIQALNNVTSEDLVVYQPMLKKETSGLSSTDSFLEGTIKREQIESITFTNTKIVPNGVIGSWDVSADGKKGVMAWYVDSDGDKLYEVTIGQDGGVIANPESNRLFYDCINLANIDFSYFDTTKVINMAMMFYNCSKLVNLNLSGFDTSKVKTTNYMFQGCSGLTSLDLSNFDTSRVTNMGYMFHSCSSLTSLDLSSFNTSNVNDMQYMFSDCSNLINLDMSNFDTSNVKYMHRMFNNCAKLANLNLSKFNTSNVTTMRFMFQGCSSLTNLDISNFDTSNVTSMKNMFQGCSSLTSLDLSSFNTSKIDDMGSLFHSCTKLTNINLSSFDTSNVTDMAMMFYQCSSLTTLDLSSFDTSNVTTMIHMFQSDVNLTTIYVSEEWNTNNVSESSYMFAATEKLIGGNGTKFNGSLIDKTYAVIDTIDTPGYLTYKANT